MTTSDRNQEFQDNYELAIKVQLLDPQARDNMIQRNMRLAKAIAYRWSKRSRSIPIEDLEQEGFLALTHAVERYDPDSGFSFATYATPWISKAIGRSIRCHSQMIRVPIRSRDELNSIRTRAGCKPGCGMDTGLAIELSQLRTGKKKKLKAALQAMQAEQEGMDTEISKSQESILDTLEHCEDTVRLLRAIPKIDQRYAQVIVDLYGINGPKLTVQQIAAKYGVTPQTVRNHRSRGIEEIRKALVVRPDTPQT